MPTQTHDVFPVLQLRCVVCHGGRTQQAKLDLRSRESILRGGKSGPAAVLGTPEDAEDERGVVLGGLEQEAALHGAGGDLDDSDGVTVTVRPELCVVRDEAERGSHGSLLELEGDISTSAPTGLSGYGIGITQEWPPAWWGD